jgi:hypothetical protein
MPLDENVTAAFTGLKPPMSRARIKDISAARRVDRRLSLNCNIDKIITSISARD